MFIGALIVLFVIMIVGNLIKSAYLASPPHSREAREKGIV